MQKISNKKVLLNRPLIFLFITGLILRLLGLINIRLGGDFAAYWKIAGQIVSGRYFPLWSTGSSVNSNLHFGPLIYYILAIPYALGRGDYRAAIIFFALVNSVNIWLIFRTAEILFNRQIGYIAALIYTFSALAITMDNFPWNYNLIPLCILLALYFLIKVRKGHSAFLPLIFVALGIASLLHIIVVLIIPVFILLVPWKKIYWQSGLAGAIICLAFLFPYLVQSGQIIKIAVPVKENCSFWSWLRYHGHGERCFNQIRNTLFIFRYMSASLFNTKNLLMAGLCFLMTAFLLLKKKLPQRKMFVIWLAIPFLTLLIYSAGIALHYYVILFPIPIFLFSLFLTELGKIKRWGTVLRNTLLYSTVFFNLLVYLVSLATIRI